MTRATSKYYTFITLLTDQDWEIIMVLVILLIRNNMDLKVERFGLGLSFGIIKNRLDRFARKNVQSVYNTFLFSFFMLEIFPYFLKSNIIFLNFQLFHVLNLRYLEVNVDFLRRLHFRHLVGCCCVLRQSEVPHSTTEKRTVLSTYIERFSKIKVNCVFRGHEMSHTLYIHLANSI